MNLPLHYPFNMIAIIIFTVLFIIYLFWFLKNILPRPSNTVAAVFKKNAVKPLNLEYFATGLNINRVKLIIDNEEPFELRGVIIRNIEDNIFSISITGDLKDGHQAY